MCRRCIPFVLLLCSAGCMQIPILHSPPRAQALLFDSAGQAGATLLVGTSSADASVSIALDNHLGVFAAGSLYDARADSSEHAYHEYGELGAVAYTTFDSSIHLEAGAGWGIGRSVGFGQ